MTRRSLGIARSRPHLGRLMVAGLTAAALTLASSAAAATRLKDTFESGATSGWSEKANVTVGSAFAHNGSFGARAVSNADQRGYLLWTSEHITQGQRYARVGGWVNIASFRAGETVSIAVVRNAHGVNHFNLWRNVSTGKFQYDLYRGDHAQSSMPAVPDRWYFIEALIDYGGAASSTYTARVRINGVEQPSITSTGQVSTTVRSAYFGDRILGNTSTRYYDDLALKVSGTPLIFTR